MQRRLRGWILCGLVIGIGVMAFADNKTFPELIKDATEDLFPSFRLAPSRPKSDRSRRLFSGHDRPGPGNRL